MKSTDERIKNLPPALKKEVEEFVNSLLKKRKMNNGKKPRRAGAPKKDRNLSKQMDAELSPAEHARIIGVLNRVTAFSVETGPPVSNRDHDRHLYGN